MPNVRIHNTVANVGLRGSLPNVRVSHSGGASIPALTIPTGTPIGLLLALTYAADVGVPAKFFSDMRPNVRLMSV